MGNIDWPNVLASYEGGVPIRDIMHQYGVSRKGLYSGLTRHGVARRGHAIGSAHPNWKGGRRRSKRTGYVRVWIDPRDPLAVMVPRSEKGSHVLEHRLVMARFLERPLAAHEEVHHKNGVRHDNRLENLQLRSTRHGRGVVAVCGECGSTNINYQEV